MGKRSKIERDKRKLINILKTEPKSMDEIIERLYRKEGYGKKEVRYVRNLMKEIERDGLEIRKRKYDGKLYYYINIDEKLAYQEIKARINPDGVFAVVSDTHYGSKYCAEEELDMFYEELKERGVKYVLHAGDIADGWLVYRGQIDELKVWGAEDQAEYCSEKYPKKKGVKTYFITGNHEAHALKKTGVDIGRLIDAKRVDLIYLAPMYARILIDEVAEIDLVHDSRRTKAYALSYPAQTRQRDTPPSKRADMSILGHRHVMLYMYYNDEHLFEAGCFQRPSPYHLEKGIHGMIGGWIIEYKLDEDAYNKFKKIKTEMLRYDI